MKMQIIPMHPDTPVTPAEFGAWERSNSISLPADYRALLLQCNGGYPYPNLMFLKLPADRFPSYGDGAFLSVIYSWQGALQQMAGDPYGDGTPPGFVFLGNESGGFEILLSLREQDFGAVYCWYHSTNIWGTGGNDESALFRQADSLAAFLAGLTDNADKDGLDYVGGAEDLASDGITVSIQ